MSSRRTTRVGAGLARADGEDNPHDGVPTFWIESVRGQSIRPFNSANAESQASGTRCDSSPYLVSVRTPATMQARRTRSPSLVTSPFASRRNRLPPPVAGNNHCWVELATSGSVGHTRDMKILAVKEVDVEHVGVGDLVGGLRSAGVESGDAVLVHCALSSFGSVVGGEQAVVEALRLAVGPMGTIVMPTQIGRASCRERVSSVV